MDISNIKDVTKVQPWPVHLALPCETHSCKGKRAVVFIGKPQDPVNTLNKLCQECFDELKVSLGAVDDELIESHQLLASQIDQLAEFILTSYPDEIGAGDPVNGESAVEVAIRLLQPKEEELTIAKIVESEVVVAGDLTNAKIAEVHIEPVVIQELPFEPEQEPDTEDVLEIDGKLITEFTVKELKQLAKEEQIEGYSNKNQGELIDLITAHFEKSEE